MAPASYVPSPAELDRLRAGVRIMALSALRDGDAAEEVAQETLVRVVEALRDDRLNEPRSLGAFTRAIAHHVIVDTIRSKRRVVPFDSSESENLTSGDNPLESLVSAEQAARLRAALERLPAPDREILRLSFFEDLQSQELATRLGQPAARIRKRKERALERLRGVFLQASSHKPPVPPTHRGQAQVMRTPQEMPD